MTLQVRLTAALINSLPCADAADADLDGDTDPIDALLVLQVRRSLVNSLPP